MARGFFKQEKGLSALESPKFLGVFFRIFEIDLMYRDAFKAGLIRQSIHILCRRLQFLQLPLDQLQMDIQGVERIAQFMGHSRGEE